MQNPQGYSEKAYYPQPPSYAPPSYTGYPEQNAGYPAAGTEYPPEKGYAPAPAPAPATYGAAIGQHGGPDDIVQSMMVTSKGWKGREAVVTDAASDRTLFTIEFRNRKPNVHFRLGDADGSEFATGTYHMYTSCRLDVTVQDRTLELRPRRLLSSDYKWASPAFGGQTMMWDLRSHFRSMDYTLIDEAGNAVARIHKKTCSLRQIAQFDILGRCPRGALDEVMVTGMTLVHFITVRNNMSAANASAASSSAAAAAAA